MNPKFLVLFLFLFLFFFSVTISISFAREADFTTWISWNVNNYNKKYVDLKNTESISEKSSRIVDWKLEMAEISKTEISVSQDGSGNFNTINEAINSIPLKNTRRVILYLNSGIYREKVNIPKTMRFLTFIGNGSEPPIITGNDTASSISGRDVKTPRTFQSATVAVDADYFIAVNVRFENTAPHVVGSVGGQAVALRISGTKAAFYNCSFYGSQDTLYDHKGFHYFSNCFIEGSVDFIFGYGTSLYENCNLNSVTKKVASLTAQKRLNASMSSGFSFKNCTIKGTGSIYLGRAWGDYSRVVFSYTFMDMIVRPQGWSDWGKRTRDQTVYYGEYKCSGPGANWTGRVPWARLLTDEEALPFIGTHYINGDTWLL